MAYRVEHRGVLLSSRESRTDPYVIAGSVSIETAIAERPVASLAVRVPPGAALAPQDFDEVTIDYPGTPYRAWAERHADLVAYWRLDEAAVTHAVDSSPADLRTPPVANATPLAFAGGNDLQYRAYRQESAAVPYGAAPEWGHTVGAGLSGDIGAIGAAFTIAGFIRLKALAAGTRVIWRGGANARRLLLTGAGVLTLDFEGDTVVAGRALMPGTWHHVAIRRTGALAIQLWLDGVQM